MRVYLYSIPQPEAEPWKVYMEFHWWRPADWWALLTIRDWVHRRQLP
jgi:hypothetical protein